ncbi:WD domain, G-beta repeat protein [Necator americanus]|uniref:Pleiotropic regulator 1 n=1 Tax=Necator americanus TaxID=51031 RepID=W2SQD8_NECAM|nr:WD domain, G-beta repeat protein [Necator americanus]ETN71939.1 WD domain, G-beta repeat protein [Necator americanus]
MSVEVQTPSNGAEEGNLPEKQNDDGEGGIQQPDQMQKTLLNLVFRSMKRTHDMFSNDYTTFPELSEKDLNAIKSIKKRCEYGSVIRHVEEAKKRREQELLKLPTSQPSIGIGSVVTASDGPLAITDGTGKPVTSAPPQGQVLNTLPVGSSSTRSEDSTTRSLLPLRAPMMVKPKWHAPWKLYRVISGHTGWVRAVDVEPQNQWFASGGGDRIIKIWDLASGKLRLSLTGHISAVRAVKVSPRHPFLFSGGEDKQVKCWDLEYNKVIRHYHGHLSAVQALSIHPTLDVLITCARDSTARASVNVAFHVWDMRTKAQVHCLAGHTNTVSDVVSQAAEPQVVTSSHDATVRLWDLASGRSLCTLTHHKKSVRSLVLHPRLYMFASASPDNIKQWKFPKGEFMQNLSGHNAIVNSLVCNEDGVLVSGGDNGSICFWDWRSGFCFQKIQTKPQPGSIDSEAGIYAMCYDKTGLRLITGEADKTIKMYKEDEEAVNRGNTPYCMAARNREKESLLRLILILIVIITLLSSTSFHPPFALQMANRTAKDAHTVRGTNPQFLIEKIIRQRIYDSKYWKEYCFALSADLVVDRALELRYIGGIYAGNVKPTPFLCLSLKMLQIQPEKDIIIEFIQQEQSKYARALGAMYLRLTFTSVEIYKYLEPLFNDYRKLRYMNKQGRFELVYMDEFIDNLLREERYCDIQLPRLQVCAYWHTDPG